MFDKNFYIYEKDFDNKLLLLNLMTFEYQILGYKDTVFWKNDQLERISVFEKLKEKNFILQDKMLLHEKLKSLTKKKLKNPTHVIFVTDECNQKCPYCFEKDSDSLRKYGKTLSIDQSDYIIKMIKKINGEYGGNETKITLFGGEPLLLKNQSIIQHLLMKISTLNGAEVNIVTNGITLDSYIDTVADNEAVISGVIVTLNGLKETHEVIRNSKDNPTFDRIINNIKLCLQKTAKVMIDINILLEKRNINNIETLLKYLYEEGLLQDKRIRVRFGRIQSRTHADSFDYEFELPYEDYYACLLDKYLNDSHSYIDVSMIGGSEVGFLGKLFRHWYLGEFIYPEVKGCEAVYPGRFCYYVDGNIYPCTEIAGNEQFKIGDYIDGEIYEDKFDRWKNYDVLNLEKCRNCRFVGMCDGACPVTNKMKNGEIENVYCLRMEIALDKMIECLWKRGFFSE